MTRTSEQDEYGTYVPVTSRCNRCGFLIGKKLALRSVGSSTSEAPFKVIYRHASQEDCAGASQSRRA